MRFLPTAAVLACLLPLAAFAGDADAYWNAWRGASDNGVAPGNPPTEWSESKNIKWKVELPGRSHATPIVWADRVYVQTAIETERSAGPSEPPPPEEPEGRRGRRRPKPTKLYEFALLALDRADGKVVWQKTLREELPHESGHPDATQASNSPVTDGQHVYAYFGSRGLYCVDVKGNVVWEKDLGDMATRNGFGEGASPCLYEDTLIVNWDHEGDSFVVALDKRTGEQRWRRDRDESTSWSTPIVRVANGQPQVIVNAEKRIRAYDLKSGELVWECGGMTTNVIPSPVATDSVAYCMSGFRGNKVVAVALAGAKGDITGTPAVAWQFDEHTPYVPSPLLYDDRLYFVSNNKAILTCLDAKTGKPLFGPERLEGLENIYASPVGAGGRVYIVGRNGAAAVLKLGDTFETLATNKLDDEFDASPAVAGDELFLRGTKALYCIAESGARGG